MECMIKKLICNMKLQTFDDVSSIIKSEFPKHTNKSIPVIISPKPLKLVSAILESMTDVHTKYFIYHYINLEVASVWSKASSDIFAKKKALLQVFSC